MNAMCTITKNQGQISRLILVFCCSFTGEKSKNSICLSPFAFSKHQKTTPNGVVGVWSCYPDSAADGGTPNRIRRTVLQGTAFKRKGTVQCETYGVCAPSRFEKSNISKHQKTTPNGVVGVWSCYPDSNWGPHPYQGCALPTEP